MRGMHAGRRRALAMLTGLGAALAGRPVRAATDPAVEIVQPARPTADAFMRRAFALRRAGRRARRPALRRRARPERPDRRGRRERCRHDARPHRPRRDAGDPRRRPPARHARPRRQRDVRDGPGLPDVPGRRLLGWRLAALVRRGHRRRRRADTSLALGSMVLSV